MTGFYTTTPKGDTIHIRGDLKMDGRTLHVITHMFDLATRQAIAEPVPFDITQDRLSVIEGLGVETIGSIHHEARYQAALAFVNTVEPTACGGLARAYRTKAGERLTTLNEVIDAAIAGELAR